MIIVKIGQRGVITLPKKMRETLGVAKGDVLGVHEKNGTLILEPQHTKSDAILSDIRKGLQEIQRGEYIEFGSIAELHRKAKKYAD